MGSRARAARYDGRVNAEATPPIPRRRRVLARALVEIRLTGLAIWRGFTRFYNSNDLTFAASIAYYSLLSFFPFFLMAFSIVALVTSSDADRDALLRFMFRYFPRQFDFVTVQLEALKHAQVRLASPGPAHGLGRDGRVRCGHHGGKSRVGRREAAELLQAQAHLLRDARGRGPASDAGLLAVSAINVVETRWFAGVVAAAPRLWCCKSVAVAGGPPPFSSSWSSAWCSTSSPTRKYVSATSGSAR